MTHSPISNISVSLMGTIVADYVGRAFLMSANGRLIRLSTTWDADALCGKYVVINGSLVYDGMMAPMLKSDSCDQVTLMGK